MYLESLVSMLLADGEIVLHLGFRVIYSFHHVLVANVWVFGLCFL